MYSSFYKKLLSYVKKLCPLFVYNMPYITIERGESFDHTCSLRQQISNTHTHIQNTHTQHTTHHTHTHVHIHNMIHIALSEHSTYTQTYTQHLAQHITHTRGQAQLHTKGHGSALGAVWPLWRCTLHTPAPSYALTHARTHAVGTTVKHMYALFVVQIQKSE